MRANCVSEGDKTLKQPPGVDQTIVWTEFPDQWAKSKRERRSSLRGLARRIRNTQAKTKAELPWLKLARFGDVVPKSGCLRTNANLRAITGIELDYDAGDLDFAVAYARLHRAGMPALLYTTRRHSSDAHRFRVLLPTSRELPPEARTKLVSAAHKILKGTLDPASFTASQAFYFGSTREKQARVRLVDPPNARSIDLVFDWADTDADALPAIDENDHQDQIEEWDLEPDVLRIQNSLELIPSDDRDTWLAVGQAIHYEFSGGEAGYELWDEWSQSSEKYDLLDQRRVWESFSSFKGKPRTIGTILKLAKEHSSSDDTFGNLRFLSTVECRASRSRGYIVKGLIAPRDITCVFGAPGQGKSLLGPYISYQIATGSDAFGMRTKQGTAFYLAAEDPHGMRGRVAALTIRQGHAPRFRLVEGVSDLLSEESPDLPAIKEAIEKEEPSLIVIDTLAMAFAGLEENDAKSMGRVVAVARELASTGAAVMLIHHDTKAENKTPRGHSILNGALDMSMHVKLHSDKIVRGKPIKNRNGTIDRDIAFRIEVEDLGTDEDGDPITAAIAAEVTDELFSPPKQLSPSQREALRILEELEADGEVSNEDWARTSCDGFRVSQSENPKSRRDVFNRARRELRDAGLIEIDITGAVRVAAAEVTSLLS